VRLFLDTNLIVRYLRDDPPEQAERAARVIESDLSLTVSEVTLAEAGYVLIHHYGQDRAAVVDALIELLQRENIEARGLDTDVAVAALGMCRDSGRVNFADALLWAGARCDAPAAVYTFDRRFPTEGIERREPA
jgi:predicted nucleic acid-binding protein